MKRKRQLLKPNMKLDYKDDPVALHHLLRIIVLAIELADVEDEEEIKKIQKNFLDLN